MQTTKPTHIEIMSPAGNFASLTAAITAGATAVYFGVEQLNMRAKAANNFKIADLHQIVKQCSKAQVKTYLTVNTILYDHDLILMKKICDAAKSAGVTAVIASDLAVMGYCKKIGLELHISTQANISNIDTVEMYAPYADVVVLARELTLQQIRYICEEIQKRQITGPSGELLRVEIFMHGALCVAISGKCYMSLATYNSSANRGACLQNCRHAYRVIDEETGNELKIDNKYIMSPKDLCTIEFVDKIIAAGVSVFKLEGRGRSADYVATVTRCYREAAESVLAGNFTQEKIHAWHKDLEKVFNRGFWHGGYYCGKKLGDWSGVYGSKATVTKECVGRVQKYYTKVGVGECILDAGSVAVGDEILISGPTTGVQQMVLKSLYIDGKPATTANKGDVITFPCDRVRKTDKLFVLKPTNVCQK